MIATNSLALALTVLSLSIRAFLVLGTPDSVSIESESWPRRTQNGDEDGPHRKLQTPATELCELRQINATQYCQKSGFYCSGDTEVLEIWSDNVLVTCEVMTVLPCPAGYYCPDPNIEPIACPRGHFCRTGSSASQECALGWLTCPDLMSEEMDWVTFMKLSLIMLLAFLIVCMVLNRVILDRIEERHAAIASDPDAENTRKIFKKLILLRRETFRVNKPTAQKPKAESGSATSTNKLSNAPVPVSVDRSSTEKPLSQPQSLTSSNSGKITSQPHPLSSSYNGKYSFQPNPVSSGKQWNTDPATSPLHAYLAVTGPKGPAVPVTTLMPKASGPVTASPSASPKAIDPPGIRLTPALSSSGATSASNPPPPSPNDAELEAQLEMSVHEVENLIASRSVDASAHASTALFSSSYASCMASEHSMIDDRSDHGSGYSSYAPQKVSLPVELAFYSLSVRLKSTNVQIVSNVCGKFVVGKITAIIGASGAGKTSLLAALRGKAYYANTVGRILLNGRDVESLSAYSHCTAFVPQDDVMYEELTVEENVLFSALLFNQRGFTTTEQALPMVHFTLDLLGIMNVRASVVGSVASKGISGGQKKRTSVALEMIKEAPLFLLDEPTSGLDSATSMSLFSALYTLGTLGHTIVTTLHQPRQEIVNRVDTLMVLAPGGRMIYCGPSFDVANHFLQMGYSSTGRENITDFVMDVLAGFVKNADEKPREAEEIVDEMSTWWERNKYPVVKREVMNAEEQPTPEPKSLTLVKATLKAVRVCQLVCLRHIRTTQRTIRIFILTCCVLFYVGNSCALLFGSIDLSDFDNPGTTAANISAMQLTFGVMVVAFGLRVFQQDALIRQREEDGGIWLGPYILGKFLAGFFEALIYPFVFLLGYFSIIRSAASFSEYWVMLLCFELALVGFANFITVTMPEGNRNLIASGMLVILWAFGGLEPTTDEIVDRMGFIGVFLNTLSPFRWSFEQQIVIEFQSYSEYYDSIIDNIYYRYDYDPSSIKTNNLWLLAYCAITTILFYLWLTLTRDHFKLWRSATDYFTAFTVSTGGSILLSDMSVTDRGHIAMASTSIVSVTPDDSTSNSDTSNSLARSSSSSGKSEAMFLGESRTDRDKASASGPSKR